MSLPANSEDWIKLILDNFYYLFYGLWAITIGAFIYKQWSLASNCIRVRVISRLTPRRVWVKPNKNDSITMEKPKKGKGIGWTFDVPPNSVLPGKTAMGFRCRDVDVYPQAKKACQYDYDNSSIVDNGLTLKEAVELSDKKILDKQGEEVKSQLNTTGLWILAMLSIVSIIISILTAHHLGIF